MHLLLTPQQACVVLGQLCLGLGCLFYLTLHATADQTSQSISDAASKVSVQRGKNIFMDRTSGHCLLCHQLSTSDAPSQGTIGPDLAYVADRLPPELLRQRIVDSRVINPETIMPAYHSTKDLRQVAQAYAGEPVLTGAEVDDLLAYLKTLSANKQAHQTDPLPSQKLEQKND